MKRTRSKSSKNLIDEEMLENLKLTKKKSKIETKKQATSQNKLLMNKPNQAEKSEINIKSKSKIKTKSEKKEEIYLLKTISPSKSDLGPKRIRLGLCCINNYLKNKKEPIICSRSMTLSTYKSKGKSEAIKKSEMNIKDISKLLKWNYNHHIECLRISSDLFPHYTNYTRIEESDRYSIKFAKEELKSAGDLSKKLEIRITMHPGQFCVVGTPYEEVFNSTIRELQMHSDILDMMELDFNSIIVIHGGGVYGNKEKTIERWIENYHKLPLSVKIRLVLENDEKNYSIIDCLKINKILHIPIVFDNHHFECYKQYHTNEKFDNIEIYIQASIDTWVAKGLRPKFHISEQNPDKVIGAHSDFIQTFPDYYLEIPKKYSVGIDIMIEAKAKEAAIFQLFLKYKNEFLGHLQNKDFNYNIFDYDKEKLCAVECERCLLDL